MRLDIAALVMALATVSSAHTISCWGKATHPPENEVHNAVASMEYAIDHPIAGPHGTLKPTVRADKHACTSVWCFHKTSIRYCNDSDQPRTMELRNIADGINAVVNKCSVVYKDQRVTGGVIDHPDHWSVVIQTDDECA